MDMQKFGVDDQQIERFMNCIRLFNKHKIISAHGDQPRKLLVMKLIDGPTKKDIILYPE